MVRVPASPSVFAHGAWTVRWPESDRRLRTDRRRSEALGEVGQREKQRPESGVDTEALALAIRSLAPKHREVLALHYRDGFDVAEIGALLEIPPGTVKSRLHHARQRLKEKLA